MRLCSKFMTFSRSPPTVSGWQPSTPLVDRITARSPTTWSLYEKVFDLATRRPCYHISISFICAPSAHWKTHHHRRPQHQFNINPDLLASSESKNNSRWILGVSDRVQASQCWSRGRQRDLHKGSGHHETYHSEVGHLHTISGVASGAESRGSGSEHNRGGDDRWRR